MKSMTGFGKAQGENAKYQVEVEIKSVNHRYLDIQIRSPKQLNEFENQLRQLIKEHLQRGRVEVFLTLSEKGDDSKELLIHWPLIEQLVQEVKTESAQRFGASELNVASLLEKVVTMPDFVEVKQNKAADETLAELVGQVVSEAALANAQARAIEGVSVRKVLAENAAELKLRVLQLADFTTTYEADYRERFEKKLQEYLGANVDQDRLLTEMTLILERGDIHEEIDRMQIHLEKLAALLDQEGPVGRELDFLIQEMNREINTVGSKSSPIEIKELVVQMKTIVEKIREQVQNIE